VILVDAQRVNASRPGRPLFRDLSLTVSTGDRLGIVGINGCGKSTLLRVLAGQERPESGEVRMGRGARVAMLAQEPVLAGSSVHEAAGGTWESDSIVDRLGLGHLLDTPVDQLSGGQAKRVALARALVETGGPADPRRADEPPRS
jgi:ATP-binding cassette subfamily F protein uup